MTATTTTTTTRRASLIEPEAPPPVPDKRLFRRSHELNNTYDSDISNGNCLTLSERIKAKGAPPPIPTAYRIEEKAELVLTPPDEACELRQSSSINEQHCREYLTLSEAQQSLESEGNVTGTSTAQTNNLIILSHNQLTTEPDASLIDAQCHQHEAADDETAQLLDEEENDEQGEEEDDEGDGFEETELSSQICDSFDDGDLPDQYADDMTENEAYVPEDKAEDAQQQYERLSPLPVSPPSTPTVDSQTPRKKASEKTMEELRMDVIREIESSEERYVEGLFHLEHCYITPLKLIVGQSKNNPKEMITMKEFTSLFQTIFVIKKVNDNLLVTLKALSSGEAREEENSIGKIFLRLGPMLKTYTDYVNNYDSIIKNIKELRKSRPVFDEIMTAIEKKALKDGKVGFIAYMVSPVQRIPRYTLLLRELVRYTDEGHEDYQNLTKAMELTQVISTHVNDRLHEMDQQKKLIELHRSVPNIESNIPEFFQTARKILYDGPVLIRKKALVSEKSKDYSLYLMTDLILLVRRNRYKTHVFLSDTPQLWAFADRGHNDIFIIVTDAYVYRMHVGSEEIRDEWVRRISDAITHSQKLITSSKEDIPKAVLYKRLRKKLNLPRVVIAQADNDKLCPFMAGEYLLIQFDYGDGSSLVSVAKENTCAVRVRNIMFRELTNEEKLSCQYISTLEKQRVIKEMATMANEKKTPLDLSSLASNGTRMATRSAIPLDQLQKLLGTDGSLDAQQTARRDQLIAEILQHQLQSSSSDDDSFEDVITFDESTEDTLSEVTDPSPRYSANSSRPSSTKSSPRTSKGVPSIPSRTNSASDKSSMISPRDGKVHPSPRDCLGAIVRGMMSPVSSPRAGSEPNLRSPRLSSDSRSGGTAGPATPTSSTTTTTTTTTTATTTTTTTTTTRARSNSATPLPTSAFAIVPQEELQQKIQANQHSNTNIDEILNQNRANNTLPVSSMQAALSQVQLRKTENGSGKDKHSVREDQTAPWLLELQTKNSKMMNKIPQKNPSPDESSEANIADANNTAAALPSE